MNFILIASLLIVVLGVSLSEISGKKTFLKSGSHTRKKKQIVYRKKSLNIREKQIEHSIGKGHFDFVEGCTTDCEVKRGKDKRKNKRKNRKLRQKGQTTRRQQRLNKSRRRKITTKLPHGHGLHIKGRSKDDPRPLRYPVKSRVISSVEYPSNVERLEYRLRPTPVVPLKKFIYLAGDVLRKIKHHMSNKHVSYNHTFNDARFGFVTDLRKVIKKINDANNEAYNVVLDAAKLTKEIYIRAHKSHLTGPSTASLSRPEVYFRDLETPTHQSDSEYRTSQDIHSKIKRMMWEAEQISQRVASISDLVGQSVLDDLTSRSQQVIYQLDRDLMIGQLKSKFEDQKYVKSNIKECENYLMYSRSDIVAVFDVLMEAKTVYERNVQMKAELLKKKGRRHPTRVSRKVSPRIGESEYNTLVQLISHAKIHADSLTNLKKYIDINLLPVLNAAKNIKKNGASTHGDKLYVHRITQKLEGDIKRLVIVMDHLRLFIGDIEGIRLRCEEIEGSGYGPIPETILECDQFIEEGSGHNFTELPAENVTTVDPDNDFVFIDGEESKPEPSTPKVKTLGDKMQAYSVSVKNNSDVILSKVETVHQTVMDASSRWRWTTNNLSSTNNINRNITSTISKVKDEEIKVNKIIAELPEKLSLIDHHLNITLSNSIKANATIERKLAELKKRKGGKIEKPDQENTVDASETTDEVTKLKSSVEKIMSLKTVLPDSCKRIQDTKNSIQLNISELRNKIEKFRVITSNLQIPRSLSGEEYLTVPVFKHRTPSLASSFEVCVKPADVESDTIVALVQQNNSLTFTLGIDDGEPEFTLYDKEGSELDTITLGDIELKNDEWYKLSVTREGRRFTFSCQHLISPDTNDTKDIIIKSVPISQPAPLNINIGGFEAIKEIDPPDQYWKGCITEVKWNRELINVFVDGNKGSLPQVCSDDCPSKKQSSIVFSGDGFIHYSVPKVTVDERIQSFSLKFRTWQEKTIIAAILNNRQRIQIFIEVINGTVLINYRTRAQYRITTKQEHFSDGKFHTIYIQDVHQDHTGKNILIDGTKDYTVSRIRLHSQDFEDGLYVGGIVNNNQLQVNDKFRPLSGCVRDLRVNEKVLNLEQSSRAHQVYFGTCDSSDMDNCARFTQNSPNITLPEKKDNPFSVMVIISSHARGHLMHYKRSNKYDFEMIMSEEGLQLYQSHEKTEPDSEKIPLPENQSKWIVITVKDNEDQKVTISLGGQSKEFQYEGDGWFGGTKKYQVSFGGTREDNSDQFTGEIKKLFIDDRFVDLKDFVASHDLSSCTEKHAASRKNIDLPLISTETTTQAPEERLQCSV